MNDENIEVFKVAASMTGDLVFKYDLHTKKLMMYSDKPEIGKYGSWIFGFKNSIIAQSKVHEEDTLAFSEFAEYVEEANSSFYEGNFRIKLAGNQEFRMYHIVAKTLFDDEHNPEKVIGKFMDVENYKEMLLINVSDSVSGGVTDLVDESGFISRIYARRNRVIENPGNIVTICFTVGDYDEVKNALGKEKTKGYYVEIVRRVKSTLLFDLSVGQLNDNTFGVFIGNVRDMLDFLNCFESLQYSIKGLGYTMGVNPRIDYGVCVMNQEEFEPIPVAVYQQSVEALNQATRRSSESVVFAKNDDGKYEENEEIVADKDFVNKLLESAFTAFNSGADNIHMLKEIFGKVGERFNIDRITYNTKHDEKYDEYITWSGEKIDDIRGGSLLHILGDAKVYDDIIGADGYVRNDIYDYPDDSEYGRKLMSSAVRSVVQKRFSHNNMTGIVSFENYNQPHYWDNKELTTISAIMDVVKMFIGRN